MFIVTPCLTATLSLLQKSQDRRLILHRLSLLLSLALGLSGCQSRPVGSASPLTPARSFTGPSAAIAQVQSSALYQHARQDCKRHDYTHAAELLKTLAAAPNLAADAVAFCNTQRNLCLKDAGLPVCSSPGVVSLLSKKDAGNRTLAAWCMPS